MDEYFIILYLKFLINKIFYLQLFLFYKISYLFWLLRNMGNAENMLKIDPVNETIDETIISINVVKLENEQKRSESSPNKVDIEKTLVYQQSKIIPEKLYGNQLANLFDPFGRGKNVVPAQYL